MAEVTLQGKALWGTDVRCNYIAVQTEVGAREVWRLSSSQFSPRISPSPYSYTLLLPNPTKYLKYSKYLEGENLNFSVFCRGCKKRCCWYAKTSW